MLVDYPWLSPLLLTLKVSCFATLFALCFGIIFGYCLARFKFPGNKLLDGFLTLPLVLPPTVIGYYLLVVIGSRGPIGEWLKTNFDINLIFTWQGAVIAATVVSLPLVHKSAKAAFEGVDKNLEDAAKTLGKTNLGIFFRISLPLAWRGLAAGGMMAFARSMGEFGATLMVAGNIPGRTQTLSLAIYAANQAGNDQLATFLVILTSCVCLLVMLITGRILKSG